MKKLIAVLLLISINTIYSDVIFPFYIADKFSAATSVEKIFTYEKHAGKSFSFLPWGGIALFWPFFQSSSQKPVLPSIGVEMALESRWYGFSTDLSKFFIGIYGGGAFMYPSYTAVGSSIGLKTGYKMIIKNKVNYRSVFEPYGSISTLPAAYSEYYHSGDRVVYFPGSILTIGFRFTSEWGTQR